MLKTRLKRCLWVLASVCLIFACSIYFGFLKFHYSNIGVGWYKSFEVRLDMPPNQLLAMWFIQWDDDYKLVDYDMLSRFDSEELTFEEHAKTCPKCGANDPRISICEEGFELLKRELRKQ